MPFSFNPESQAPAPGQGFTSASGVSTSASQAAAASAAPSVPDSPFLFMRQRGQEMSINSYLQIILIIVAILSVVASIILFSYSMYLTASISSKKDELVARDATFKEYPIDDMKRTSKRFSVLGQILKDYLSVRSPLKLLEDVVENQAVFDNFNLTRNSENSGYSMAFSVITNNYRVLLQQLDALNLSQYSKIVPQKKLGTVADSVTSIKIQVTAPVFASGLLSDDVVFVPVPPSSSAGVSTGSTTP
jgi:hypothetical protein